MFTGIIEEKGRVESVRITGGSGEITVRCAKVLSGTNAGDSIAVNGVCLTVTKLSGGTFTADIMPRTLQLSSLAGTAKGAFVNLERAVPSGGRFGGHIVSGHIDGTGVIRKIIPDENALLYAIEADDGILRYVAVRGSIAVDGISLTVSDVKPGCFTVSVIPHTRDVTALSEKKAGGVVNLECDIIAKYIERLLSADNSGARTNADLSKNVYSRTQGEQSLFSGGRAPGDHVITEDFLRENGF